MIFIASGKAEGPTDPTDDQEDVRANVGEAERLRKLLVARDRYLIDEIDEVLEENAEEFVRNFVQKPGK